MDNQVQNAEQDAKNAIQHAEDKSRESEVDKQAVEAESRPDPTALAQAALLRMARAMRREGHIHEALETYCQVIERYPETDAARAGVNGMADLAQYCEDNGMPHMAMEIYCQLEEMR